MIAVIYVDFDFYKNEFGGSQSEEEFNRLALKASRKMDIFTTGIDGIRKLDLAFPTNEYDANAVKLCASDLIDLMAQVEAEKQSAAIMNGFIEGEDGTVHNKLVSSVSSGTESISYATSGSATKSTAITEAIKSIQSEKELYFSLINDALSGVMDNNGVNLLFMGRYPFRV